jgi:hypothetical protein
VLRQAAARLSELGPPIDPDATSEERFVRPLDALLDIFRRLQTDDTATRLILRDLADGGHVAVESLTPPLRSAFDRFNAVLGDDDNPTGRAQSRLAFLGMAAPLFLIAAAWPVISHALDLQPEQRERLFAELVLHAIDAYVPHPE